MRGDVCVSASVSDLPREEDEEAKESRVSLRISVVKGSVARIRSDLLRWQLKIARRISLERRISGLTRSSCEIISVGGTYIRRDAPRAERRFHPGARVRERSCAELSLKFQPTPFIRQRRRRFRSLAGAQLDRGAAPERERERERRDQMPEKRYIRTSAGR